MLDSLQDRWRFAFSDDEQRYETRLISERRFYNQIALYPVNFVHDLILAPHKKAKWGVFGSAAAWRFVDQWLMKATAGQLVRSMTSGYDKRQHYLSAQETVRSLMDVAVKTQDWQDGSLTPVTQIQQAQRTALQSMLESSGKAGDMLERFMHGTLDITPSHIAQLETHCRAMSELCTMRASLLAHPQTGEAMPPVDVMRDMLDKPALQTARDAQLMLALAAALVVDSAIPFSSEVYVPQENIYLSESESRQLRAAITRQPLPANASKEEVLNYAQQLRHEVKRLFGPRLPRLLDFAEEHQTMMGKLLVPDPKPADPDVELVLRHAKPTLPAVQSGAARWHTGGDDITNPLAALGALRHHMLRPEATHEMHKLYGRNLANQIIALPTAIVEEALRKFFETSQPGKPRSGFDVMLDRMKGQTGTQMKQLFNAQHFVRTLNSKGFHFIAKPFGASVMTVGIKDAISGMAPAIAIEASDRAHLHLRDGLHSCLAQDAGLREQLALLHRPNPSLIALLEKPENQALLTQLLQDKPLANAEDYKRLEQLFGQVSQLARSTAQSIWQRLSPDAQATDFPQSLHALLQRPVTTPAQAMLAFALVDTFMQASREAHAMSEYVNPKDIPLSVKQLGELGRFVSSQAAAAHIKPASPPEDLVRLANVIMDKVRGMGVDARMGVMLESSYRNKAYTDHIMERIAGKEADPAAKPSLPHPVDPALTQPWQGQGKLKEANLFTRIHDRFKQPETKHEMQKLHDRQQGEKGVGAFSSLVENSLRHGNALLDRGNLFNAAWTYLVHPYVYGMGIVHMRETLDEAIFQKETTLRNAKDAAGLLNGLQRSAAAVDPHIRQSLSGQGITNADMAALNKYRDIPALAAKPEAERTENDHKHMVHFFHQSGDAILRGYGHLFSALLKDDRGVGLQQALERSTGVPVASLPEAVLGSGFVGLMLKESSAQQNQLRYLPPQEGLLPRKQLMELSGYVVSQAQLAGLRVADKAIADASAGSIRAGELVKQQADARYAHPDAQTMIRFNNVVTQKLRELSRGKPGHDVRDVLLHGALSGKMVRSMQQDVLPSLIR